ncbi:hypothetical protein IPC954_04540 [Pseudomonas aeruginosa]|nr:hypothetical protein IPC976_02550 [Pseudomonas aeruginosa]RPT72354.1 hypothetical protein IPC948_11040 [Pseudomonas aeruginosa]RPT73902.1 hypothetical protein IPC954_04540 [Pseudomonas aeruginosa]RPT78579.1 hypothetical protein IPC946_11120 [Pseudomonas aeruginosa]RPU14259.1 hypothetical protein IPC924_02550 [Pseudomonas aeruginosa]
MADIAVSIHMRQQLEVICFDNFPGDTITSGFHQLQLPFSLAKPLTVREEGGFLDDLCRFPSVDHPLLD